VTKPGPRALLQPVSPADVGTMLADALAGGPPIAPLSNDPVERRQSLAMLAVEEPVAEPDVAVVVSTSGSTGRPKGVVLSRAAIRASVALTHARLGGTGDWALALPPHYVAGLMVLARAIVGGGRAHPVRADLGDLPEVLSTMADRRYLALVPTQLVRALAQPAIASALAHFDAVLIGAAALPSETRSSAEAVGIRVVSTYGMTETCGGCVYDGVPLDGVTINLDKITGRVLISSPTIFTGYRLRPDLTTQSLSQGRFRTSDRGRWSPDGRLEVLGRLDDSVISNGFTVDLAEVERVARSWPALGAADLAVIAVPDPQRGTVLVAVTDGTGSIGELKEFLAGRLPGYAAPGRLVLLDSLPRTAGGKIDRARLVQDLNQESPDLRPFVSSETASMGGRS
jgi:O-succinylbenzoic acid--CoA ligase